MKLNVRFLNPAFMPGKTCSFYVNSTHFYSCQLFRLKLENVLLKINLHEMQNRKKENLDFDYQYFPHCFFILPILRENKFVQNYRLKYTYFES